MNSKRTFLLGAGFSRAVANAPLMNELWSKIEKVYNKEKAKNKRNREKWYKDLSNFIDMLEYSAKNNIDRLFDEKHKIDGGIRNNLEYLYTLIDLHIIGVPCFNINKEGVNIEPFPIVPLGFNKYYLPGELIQIRDNLTTLLYIVFVNLESKCNLLKEFSSFINQEDEFITFNYDLLLEKALWARGLWSPLGGYIGVSKFSREDDYKALKYNKRDSKIGIHKMHGSISWERSFDEQNILITLDDKENSKYHFEGLEKYLNRQPLSFEENVGYAGGYNPPWIFPSFIKPFNIKEIFEIWKSAINVLNNTKILIIVGYSFRPEDTNSQLLLATLPNECEVILIDPKAESIRDRLKKLNIEINSYYNSLEEFLKINRKCSNFI